MTMPSKDLTFQTQCKINMQDLNDNKVWHTTNNHHFKTTYFEWEVLDVLLDRRVTPGAADQSLGIKHSVLRVGGQLVLGSITDETLSLGSEGHI